MESALTLIAVIFLVYLLATSQPFRSVVWKAGKIGVVLVLIAAAGVGLYLLIENRREATRRTLIKHDEVALNDLTLSGYNLMLSGYRLEGTVKNTSRYPLHIVGAKVVILDCVDAYADLGFVPDAKQAGTGFEWGKDSVPVAKRKHNVRDLGINLNDKPRFDIQPGHVETPRWSQAPVVPVAEQKKRPLSPDEKKALGFDKYPGALLIYMSRPEHATCETIGETSDTIYVNVPAGQVRALSEHVYFSDVPPLKGEFGWMLVLDWLEAS
jgi:hypothetical protein